MLILPKSCEFSVLIRSLNWLICYYRVPTCYTLQEIIGGEPPGDTKSYCIRQKRRPGLRKMTAQRQSNDGLSSTWETRRGQRKAHPRAAWPPTGIGTRGSSPSTATAAAAGTGSDQSPGGHRETLWGPRAGAAEGERSQHGREWKEPWDGGKGRVCLTTGCRAEGRLRAVFMWGRRSIPLCWLLGALPGSERANVKGRRDVGPHPALGPPARASPSLHTTRPSCERNAGRTPYRLTAGRRGKRAGCASAAFKYRPPLPRDPREPNVSGEGGEGEPEARVPPPPIGRAGARDWRRCTAPHQTGSGVCVRFSVSLGLEEGSGPLSQERARACRASVGTWLLGSARMTAARVRRSLTCRLSV